MPLVFTPGDEEMCHAAAQAEHWSEQYQSLAGSSVVEPRPVKPVVEGSNPSPPASIVELFADVPAECEPYDNGFDPRLFVWEDPCL